MRLGEKCQQKLTVRLVNYLKMKNGQEMDRFLRHVRASIDAGGPWMETERNDRIRLHRTHKRFSTPAWQTVAGDMAILHTKEQGFDDSSAGRKMSG